MLSRTLFSSRNRVVAAVAIVAVTAIVIVAVAYAITEAMRLQIEADSQAQDVAQLQAARLGASIEQQQASIGAYLLSGQPNRVEAYRQAVTQQLSLTGGIADALVAFPAVNATLSSLTAATAAWRSSVADRAIAAVQQGDAATKAALIENSQPGLDATMHSAVAALNTELVATGESIRQRAASLATIRALTMLVGLGMLLVAAALALWLISRFGLALEGEAQRSSVINRFAEATNFAADDRAVAASVLEALTLLLQPDAAVVHVLNHSSDRAIPEASLGDAQAELLALSALNQCPGVARSTTYLLADASAPLSVKCPVYPIDRGTLICVPLTHREAVGAVHLHWKHPTAFSLEQQAAVSQVAGRAALAIGNRRLMAALHGQANTDPRTGLANSRAFDIALEDALRARQPEEAVSVLMLDIDHFKEFNDRHGHPAGDEALRTFAEVLRSSVRDRDLAARYGGEEFVVLLPGLDLVGACEVAERIRERTESKVMSLAPGLTDRISVSIGVASAPTQAVERVALLRIADEALYEAKQAGRNRVHPSDDAGDPPHERLAASA